MILEPQVTFRNVEASTEIEAEVRKEAARLDKFFPRIMSCRVAVEGPAKPHYGGLYRVRIDLGVPGEELVVERIPNLQATLERVDAEKKTKRYEPRRELRDVSRAIHDAFHEMRRRLQDYVRRIQGETKAHEVRNEGTVVRVFPEEGYGFLEAEGREIYFHRNSVLSGHFDRLRPGSAVRFVEEMGDRGPQASTVKLVRAARQGRKAAETVLVRRPRGTREGL